MNDSDNSRLPALTLLMVAGVVIVFVVLHVQGALNLGEGLLILALAGYFPLTYVAYEAFQRPVRLKRLSQDFRLLGIDAEAPQMAQKLYKQSHNPWNYALHITLVILLTVVGLALFFWAPAAALLDVNTLQAMQFGFLGAYVFSAQLIYRRYTTSDLQPNIYLQAALTLIAGLAFNYTAFQAVGALAQNPPDTTFTGAGAGLAAVVAFALGYFPNLAIRWFNRLAHDMLSIDRRRADDLPLGLIDGISQWHEARLRDIGIDNVQNLASTDIRELLLNTTFGGQQVIDWIDQAILYLYLSPDAIDRLREKGVRTVSDFHEMWESLAEDGEAQAKQELIAQLPLTEAQLRLIYKLTTEGPNLPYVLNYWQNFKAIVSKRQETYREQDISALDMALEEAESAMGPMVASQRRAEPTSPEAISFETGEEPAEMAKAKMMPQQTAALDELGQRVRSLRRDIVQKGGTTEEASPRTARAWVGQGNLYMQDGRIEEAIDCYEAAVDLDPDYAMAYALLGQALLNTGEHAAAGDAFDKAVEKAPASPLIRNNRGAYYQAIGHLDKALADLEEARRLNPNMVEIYINLGNVCRDMGRDDDAIANYKEAIRLDETNALAYNNLAWLYVEKDINLEEALEKAQKAVDLYISQNGRPNPSFLDTLAVAQHKNGLLEEALDTLDQAKSLSPPPHLEEDIAQHQHDVERSIQERAET